MGELKLILQGFVIGIGKIIPGVSGAMFAMMFGVYEKALDIISHLKTKLFKNLKFMFLLGISILLAIILGSNIIKKCLDNYYFFTMIFFVGMMTAGIKPLFENVKNEKLKFKNILCAIIISLLLFVLDFIDFGTKTEVLSKTPFTFLMLILSGFCDAIGTIVPGVCGTAFLMILGYYDVIITSLSDILNFSNLANNLFVLVPFVIGMILGILLISKIIDFFFKNYKVQTYYVIIGFAIMSTILLSIKAIAVGFTIVQLIIGIILFIIGYFIVKFFEKLEIKR